VRAVERQQPLFTRSHGKPRVDGLQVLSGNIFIQRYWLMWNPVPEAYVPPMMFWKRWGIVVIATIMTKLVAQAQDTGIVMIDATHAKPHRIESSPTV
jgi:hypothetical protein